jgi:hypothetical protein
MIFSVMAVFSSSALFAQADTTATDTTVEKKVKKRDLAGHQLAIGMDLYHPIVNAFLKDRYANEIITSYYLHNEYYLAVEGGWGGNTVNYINLAYNTTNNFYRIGFDKSVLGRDTPHDWDMMFIGLRAAFSDIHRSTTSFTIVDPIWGNATGTQPPVTFLAYWAEITGGVRVEFLKGLFVGWNFRGKFLMNGKSFTLNAPQYIAGYGRGDKNSVFDFDVYVSYGIRWKRNSVAVVAGTIKPVTNTITPVDSTNVNKGTPKQQ